MNTRILIQSGKLISRFSRVQTSLFANSRSIYYAAHPYPNNTIKKFMKFLTDNKEELAYVPPILETAGEINRKGSQDILNLTAEQEKKLKLIKWEFDLLMEKSPYSVPEKVSDAEWMKLIEIKSSSQRRKYLKSLRIKENEKTKDKKRITEKSVRQSPEFHSLLFLWVLKNTVNTGYNERICESLMNGPHCVVDMGFENQMIDREVKNTVIQLLHACSVNKENAEPFHITFSDLKRDCYSHKQLYHQLSKSYIYTEASLMDIFPTEKYIYLTPDSPNEMKVYDPEAIYIIGGMVDLSSQGSLSYAKAKKLQIRTEKFPIDRYLVWEKGSKNLTLNQVFNILNTIKDSGNWLEAFKHVPVRKLRKFD